ncbi:SsgA family sporulation/cell division regulator [Streptomyces flaveolus]|uniref:SsgA family sporulation/cell division regulator n=1 Tax=Streptomyces flaveolus TaxID=67297 RepID=UPI001671390C|nr:SsgA family sporulation/cell division regulator [Streptomyces flaveolus]
MSQHPTSVMRTVTALVSVAEDRRVPLSARLSYQLDDPYAVRLSLGAPAKKSAEWVFARELLADGMRRPAGVGDVLVFPRHGCLPDTMRIVLRSSTGAALLELSASLMTAFLHNTYDLVAPGAEGMHVDLDGCLARLAEPID